ncbi:substance-P receptor-like [Oculina patagonica]
METPTNVSWKAEKEENATSAALSTSESTIFGSLAAVYFIIIFASIFGNSVIIHIIRTRHFLKTATNKLILNQACADLIITFTAMWSMLNDELFNRKWFGGSWGLLTCRMVIWATFPAPYCSIWSLTAIAVDRYFAVARPLHLSPISRHIKLVISVLWLWSFASAAGMVSMAKLRLVNNDEYYCVVDFLHVELTALNITSMCIQLFFNFVVPLVVMTALYSIVCWRLLSREVPGEGGSQDQRHEEAMKTAKKVTRMMIIVVVLFVLCWFPFYVFVGLDSLHKIVMPYAAVKFVVWLANAYSAINPYIYLSFNGKFRKEFVIITRNLFRKCNCC